jgi:hypothetical protein
MDLFRCPVCLGILAEPEVARCPTCGGRLDRHPPIVLDAAGRPDKGAAYTRTFGRRRTGRRFGSKVEG